MAQKVAARKPRAKPTRRKGGKAGAVLHLDGHDLKLTNLDKVLYPAAPGGGFTKGDVIDYYARICPVLLPHFRDRPVTLVRFPDGVEGEHFYEKNCPTYRPPWMDTHPVPRSTGGNIDFCVLNDAASVVWVANLAALELHPYLHRQQDIDTPTHMVFDFDPGPDQTIRDCAKTALLFRDMLEQVKLRCFAKTSGGKGIHLAVPFNTKVTYDQTKSFAQSLATLLEREHPDRYTANMSKAKRGGRIFIDWSQNSIHKTTAGAYSLRAKETPRVSMPLTWDEVESLSRSRKKDPIDMSPKAVLKRVEKHGDLFEEVLTLKQRMPSV